MELKIEHLSKQFKDKTAVNDVNLTSVSYTHLTLPTILLV